MTHNNIKELSLIFSGQQWYKNTKKNEYYITAETILIIV